MRLLDFNTSASFENTGSTSAPKVAVIGGGVSGLGAVYGLRRAGADVTLFEQESRIGGHAHTVDVQTAGGSTAVDTGFIVFNEQNYQNLVGLLDALDVETSATTMSFAASMDKGAFEYSGSGAAGMLSRRRNLVSPRFWAMLQDLLRFYKTAPELLAAAEGTGLTLGEFLDQHQFGTAFRRDHLLPMAAAIWSSPTMAMEDYPVDAFVRFFRNHGLLLLKDRPQWRTIVGGSRNYVEKLLAVAQPRIVTNARITTVKRRDDGVDVLLADGSIEHFDHVVLATHAPTALSLLDDATAQEQAVLGAFSVHRNQVYLHTDAAQMPRRKRAWSAWNYIDQGQGGQAELPCVSYWMNALQPLTTQTDLFITLNPQRNIDDSYVLGEYSYDHPAFDMAAIKAQAQMRDLQGQGGVWFAGAWMGYGFHEDGLEAGLGVAEAISGVARPWEHDPAKARVAGAPAIGSAALIAAE